MLRPRVHRTPEKESYFTRLIPCSTPIIRHRATLSNNRPAKTGTVQQIPENNLTFQQNPDVLTCLHTPAQLHVRVAAAGEEDTSDMPESMSTSGALLAQTLHDERPPLFSNMFPHT